MKVASIDPIAMNMATPCKPKPYSNRKSGRIGASHKSPRLAPDALTPQAIYEDYLLYVLAKDFDGQGHKRDVTHAIVKRMMKDGFIGAADQELVSTGETKAENTITWARNALKQRGYISRAARRGIWELTPEGKSAAGKVVLPKPGQP